MEAEMATSQTTDAAADLANCIVQKNPPYDKKEPHDKKEPDLTFLRAFLIALYLKFFRNGPANNEQEPSDMHEIVKFLLVTTKYTLTKENNSHALHDKIEKPGMKSWFTTVLNLIQSTSPMVDDSWFQLGWCFVLFDGNFIAVKPSQLKLSDGCRGWSKQVNFIPGPATLEFLFGKGIINPSSQAEVLRVNTEEEIFLGDICNKTVTLVSFADGAIKNKLLACLQPTPPKAESA